MTTYHGRSIIMDPQPGEPETFASPSLTLRHQPKPPPAVRCDCGHLIFDGEAVRSRCVKPAAGIALCRCKRWMRVPVQLVQ